MCLCLEAVEHDDDVASREQPLDEMRADEARAASYEYAHRLILPPFREFARGDRADGRRSASLQRQLLEHGLHRDDVPLEAELGVRQARRDADQLRQVEDRHLEVLAGLLLQLRLPCVE